MGTTMRRPSGQTRPDSLVSPDLVIRGGGVRKDHAHILDQIRTRAENLPAQLFNDAGIVGAAQGAALAREDPASEDGAMITTSDERGGSLSRRPGVVESRSNEGEEGVTVSEDRPVETSWTGWFDVSVPLDSSTPVYQGDPPYHRELATAMSDGAECNVSKLELGVHTGTHVDTPIHFLAGGTGAEAIPLEAVMGLAWVVDASSVEGTIDETTLRTLHMPDGETRLLFRTPAATLWDRPGFATDFVGLDESAAAALVARGVRLVGCDYLSIAPFASAGPTHRTFLAAGVVIVEGLDLRRIAPGPYELICLPLRIVGSDGAPARALLRPRGRTGTT